MFVFRKLWRALFLETPVLRFALLPYYRRDDLLHFSLKLIHQNFKFTRIPKNHPETGYHLGNLYESLLLAMHSKNALPEVNFLLNSFHFQVLDLLYIRHIEENCSICKGANIHTPTRQKHALNLP